MTDKEITIKLDTTDLLKQLNGLDVSNMDSNDLKRYIKEHIEVIQIENDIWKVSLNMLPKNKKRDEIWEKIPKQWRV